MTKKQEMVFADSSTAMVDNNLIDELIGVGSGNEGAMTYLKFSQNGQWLYGADDDVLENNEPMYVDASSFVVGSICWEDGKVVDESCVPYGQRASLQEVDNGKPFLGVNFRAVEDGLDFEYRPSSGGGIKFIRKLMFEVGTGLKTHGADKIAIVNVAGDSYKNKKHGGKTFFPTFEIVGWAGQDGKEIKKLAA